MLPFEREAMNGDPLPDGLSIEDQSMYLALRNLYSAHRQKLIDREQAGIEKRKLFVEYSRRKKLSEAAERNNAHTVSMWRDMEGLVSAYRKNRTLEIADKLADATQGKIIDWKRIEEGE